jgi:hypothetical protein
VGIVAVLDRPASLKTLKNDNRNNLRDQKKKRRRLSINGRGGGTVITLNPLIDDHQKNMQICLGVRYLPEDVALSVKLLGTRWKFPELLHSTGIAPLNAVGPVPIDGQPVVAFPVPGK